MEMRQFVPVNGLFIGEPPNTDPSYRAFCPMCGRVLSERAEGYGLAYGGGVGHYQYCCNSKCDWFYKMLDADEAGENNAASKPSDARK